MITYCFGGLAGSAKADAGGKKAQAERRAAKRTANDILKKTWSPNLRRWLSAKCGGGWNVAADA
jgi:hypothetical protein